MRPGHWWTDHSVVPELDPVIVTTARTEESIFELIDQYVIPAVQKSQ